MLYVDNILICERESRRRGSIGLSNNIGERRCELKANEPARILSDNTSGSSEMRVTGIIRNILYYSRYKTVRARTWLFRKWTFFLFILADIEQFATKAVEVCWVNFLDMGNGVLVESFYWSRWMHSRTHIQFFRNFRSFYNVRNVLRVLIILFSMFWCYRI